jgi:hypothetical protein
MKKYSAGGRSRPAPSYEEDMTPPPGMRNFRPQMRRSNEGPVPSYEEDITPPPGMMRSREEPLPLPPKPPAVVPPRRMKVGGAVTRGDGCASKGKTKGRMV